MGLNLSKKMVLIKQLLKTRTDFHFIKQDHNTKGNTFYSIPDRIILETLTSTF
jgi:hypothetical protein